MNVVNIVGRLGQAPELREVGDKKTATISVATKEYGDKTEWHRVCLWGKDAEVVAQYVAKGDLIAITGRLQTREYTTKDGEKKYTTEIVANRVTLCGGKNSGEERPF
jgi:single-strand DNA-binding protein